MWFWGINIPNCYGSGTTRARGAPHGWFAPHGDGREGVFGSLPFMARSSMRPVSGDSLARVCPSGQTSCRLMRTECRFAIRASRATPSPPIPQLRLVQGRRNAAQWASRFADSEVGRMGRVRRVGQWFLEICFRSFAQDLATPSARNFAQDLASPRGLCASRMNQNRRIQCNRQGAFAQDLANHRQGALSIEFLMR